jgi:hypothetical protein
MMVVEDAMYHDAFKPLPETDAQDFLRAAMPLLDGAPFGGDVPRVLARSLPFYPDHELIEALGQTSHPPVLRVFVRKKNTQELTLLNWTNEPVYHLNQHVPIRLDVETVLPYVRFFFNYIKGKHGRFLIVDSPDEIEWKDEPPPAGRKALAKMIEPLRIITEKSDGTFLIQASMIFKDSLFSCTVTVEPDGQVSLSDEELVVEDIPVRDDTLGL